MKDERLKHLWPIGTAFDCPTCGYGATIDRASDFEVRECRGGRIHRISVPCPLCGAKKIETSWATSIPPALAPGIAHLAVTKAAAMKERIGTVADDEIPTPGG